MAQFSLVGSPEPFYMWLCAVAISGNDGHDGSSFRTERTFTRWFNVIVATFANEESLFQQHIEAVRGDEVVLNRTGWRYADS